MNLLHYFGSYCNILIRIFNKIKEPKNYKAFIKTVLDLSIRGFTIPENSIYETELKKSFQFNRIRDFYKSIYTDDKLSLYYGKDKAIELKNNKFKKLLKWTLKCFEANLNK